MPDIFYEIIKKSKNKNQLMIADQNYKYSDFFLDVDKDLEFLKKKVKEKEVICFCSSYSKSFISMIFAAYQNKNVITFANPNIKKRELIHIINDSAASLVFFENSINLDISNKKIKEYSNFRYYLSKKKNTCIKSGDIFIIYTSGTTRQPKGAILTLKSISKNVSAIADNFNLNSNSSTVIFSPPAYAMGISQILSFMCVSGKFILYNNGLKFPNEIINLILKFKLNHLNISLSAFRILLKYNIYKKNFYFVKTVSFGGMQVVQNDINLYKKVFPRSNLINFYGCTENSPRISHFKIDINKNYKICPVGKPLKGVKVRILKSKKDKNLFGKVIVSGSSLMRRYNKISLSSFSKNSFYTGDLGYFDEKRDLVIIGRDDFSFRVGHEKLCPEEVEAIIKKKLNYNQLIISKKKHEVLNWIPVLIINKRKKINFKNLTSYLDKNIANYKIPKELFYVNKIPLTHYGKINRLQILKKL